MSFDRRTANKNNANKKVIARGRFRKLMKTISEKSCDLKAARRRDMHLSFGRSFGVLLGTNYISRLERAISKQRTPQWVRTSSPEGASGETLRSLFGPGALAGVNASKGQEFNLGINQTSVADMVHHYTESNKHNLKLRRRLRVRGSEMDLRECANLQASKNGTGLQFVWRELGQISRILTSLSKTYLRDGACPAIACENADSAEEDLMDSCEQPTRSLFDDAVVGA